MKTPTVAVLRSNPKDAALSRLVRSLSGTYRVTCLVWDRQGDFRPAATGESIRYLRCGLRAGFYSLGTLCKLALFQLWLFFKLMTLRCDAIHAVDLDTGLPGGLAARLRKKPFVYQCLDPYYANLPANWPRFLAAWARRLENRLISGADLFIITDRLRMPQHEGATPKRTVEVANVPVLPELPSAPKEEGGVFTVGYLGTLIEGRNLATLIEACGELEGEDVRLVIGGFGPLEGELAARAARWPNVIFHGFLPYERMLQMEAGFDLFVHVTDPQSESQKWVSPNKLFEAMALGKPIIAGRETLTARRVELFGNGAAVAYGSKEELQQAIRRFKDDSDLAQEMGKKGREEFRRNWRPEMMERRLLDAYGEVLGERSGEAVAR